MISENTKSQTLRRLFLFVQTNVFKGKAGHCKGLGIISFFHFLSFPSNTRFFSKMVFVQNHAIQTHTTGPYSTHLRVFFITINMIYI